MISRLAGRHAHARIAIVGSGPTAMLYRGGEVSIAVNGAALLPYRFDYFMCGDPATYQLNWFHVNCADVRVIADIVATMDEILYPSSVYKLERMAVHQHQRHLVGRLPDPVKPHIVFRYKQFKDELLKRDASYLMYGGTISCCALQLAWIMGASIIDIYGCPFSHNSGSYFYNSDKPGVVVDTQYQIMQKTIDHVRKDVQVNIVGESRLR